MNGLWGVPIILIVSTIVVLSMIGPNQDSVPLVVVDSLTTENVDSIAFAAKIKQIKLEEGFRSEPYRDQLGTLTIGYGTNLSNGISEKEGDFLLRERFFSDLGSFVALWPPYMEQPIEVRVQLADMAYQLGPVGVSRFGATLRALEICDYETAARHVLASLWASQTPQRADITATVFRGIPDGVCVPNANATR